MYKSYSDPKSAVFSTSYSDGEVFTSSTWQKRGRVTRLFLRLCNYVNLNCAASKGHWSW